MIRKETSNRDAGWIDDLCKEITEYSDQQMADCIPLMGRRRLSTMVSDLALAVRDLSSRCVQDRVAEGLPDVDKNAARSEFNRLRDAMLQHERALAIALGIYDCPSGGQSMEWMIGEVLRLKKEHGKLHSEADTIRFQVLTRYPR